MAKKLYQSLLLCNISSLTVFKTKENIKKSKEKTRKKGASKRNKNTKCF